MSEQITLPEALKQLVDKYEFHRQGYLADRYNEAQLRLNFTDQLFRALGWDVYNDSGYSEAYKEVLIEEPIKIGATTLFIDYTFRIGGIRKFIVETKKPSVKIKDDSRSALQVRRYAWNAKLPLNILTNFEEFAIYDCTIKPQHDDTAATARIEYFTWQDLPKKWEWLASIFTKESILRGSFDKYAKETKGKRGTANVDDTILAEIEEWRDVLAKNIALRNPSLSVDELNDAVQKTIDRILFLRICEDRGIEPYGCLQKLIEGDNTYQRLCDLFRRADERYNSGLFHFNEEKDNDEIPDRFTLDLAIDDKVLKGILKRLYYPDSPFEFSVIPPVILGHVYEQFLGKVIRLTEGHQAKVEYKPEVKKAGGVFYTPQYIVDYIVKQTVGELVKDKSPREVTKLRILDPACGSGSFLLGAYQYLLNWHRDWYIANLVPVIKEKSATSPEIRVLLPESTPRSGKIKSPAYELPIFQAGNGGDQRVRSDWKLTTAERKRILLNNIYGVDIDRQAVEVTKLSLLLKVLEEESQETVAKQLTLFQERALPSLHKNIKCGNSLIGTDIYKDVQVTLDNPEVVKRINAFDWDREFSGIKQGGGFDAVIGNPPYVLLGKDLFQDIELKYLRKYRVAQYKTDLFHLFIQKGIDLLGDKGRFGFIIPNQWISEKFTDKLRKYILESSNINEIVIFAHSVFINAKVFTALLILQREKYNDDNMIKIKPIENAATSTDIENAISYSCLQAEWKNNEQYQFETRLIGEKGNFVKSIIKKWPDLEHVARASLGCQAYNKSKHTKDQIKNRVYHSDIKLNTDYLPELAGNDIRRYLINRTRGQWIKYGPWLHDYRTIDWLTGPRILIREITDKPPHQIQSCYTEETYCNYKTILNVNPASSTSFSMKYLLGILNSKLISFIYPFVSNKLVAVVFPRLSVGDLKRLPIRTINFSDPGDKSRHDRMVTLVEQILDLHKRLPEAKLDHDRTLIQRQIEATDKQIDELVYELYGLTEEEIAIVEAR